MRMPATLSLCVMLSAMLKAQTAMPKVTQTVTVTAENLGPDETYPYAYFTLMMDCINHVNAHSDPGETITACKKLADEADKFDPKSHFVTRRGAYVYYASALMQGQQYTEALAAAEKAVAVVLLGHDDASGSSAAYETRAEAKAWMHDLSGSDKDLETSEAYERKALAVATSTTSTFLQGEHTKTLKGLLNFQAQILVRLGDQDAANSKLAEANRL